MTDRRRVAPVQAFETRGYSCLSISRFRRHEEALAAHDGIVSLNRIFSAHPTKWRRESYFHRPSLSHWEICFKAASPQKDALPWRSSCVFCGLRAARFTRTPKPKSQPAFAYPCLRAVWLTRVLNLYEAKGVLSVAWGTRGLKRKIRRLKNVHHLRVVRFTRTLKPQQLAIRVAQCLRVALFTFVFNHFSYSESLSFGLRAMRFTLGLNENATLRSTRLSLRAVWFTRALKRPETHRHARQGLRAVRFTMVLKPAQALTSLASCLRAVRFTMVLKQRGDERRKHPV